ncbi:hypothetical protein Fmac_032266 [Flemingia macrophylla]|uniref:Uncharacterized protein n=1 Tax=Flemingia macrophylla TaxID=520843 RepID=A0ABD1L4E0_9FABA
MRVSLRHQCLLLTLLAFVVLSEGSRLPKEYWEQMLPKKLPSPSSSPSKGTNSVNPSSTTKNYSLPTSDGKFHSSSTLTFILPQPFHFEGPTLKSSIEGDFAKPPPAFLRRFLAFQALTPAALPAGTPGGCFPPFYRLHFEVSALFSFC